MGCSGDEPERCAADVGLAPGCRSTPAPTVSRSRAARPLSMSAPIAAIIRSVWSRDSAGWMTVVSPSAYSPAMRMHDLSWALATGISYSMPLRLPPLNASGASEPPFRPITCAPIISSGSRIRFIGLRRSDESPVITLKKCCAARRPETSLIVVPLLPEYRASSGSASPSLPLPEMLKNSLSPEAPSAQRLLLYVLHAEALRRQPSIEVLSSPTQKLETTASPSEIAFSNAARCEIDLSPGGTTVPSRRELCWTVRFTCLISWTCTWCLLLLPSGGAPRASVRASRPALRWLWTHPRWVSARLPVGPLRPPPTSPCAPRSSRSARSGLRCRP